MMFVLTCPCAHPVFLLAISCVLAKASGLRGIEQTKNFESFGQTATVADR
jgi:hypothetical protein